MTNIHSLLTVLAEALQITRPLAALDLETTGVNAEQDRIVEVTIGRIRPGAEAVVERFLVNPGVPIPATASAIHGITDEQVKDAPTFAAVAQRVCVLLRGADLIGFNHRRFDVRMIAAECQRVGLSDPCAGARLVDVCRIFHAREPRDLTGAVRFYCEDDHADAHGTTADVEATLRVLVAQFGRYEDLPRDLDALHALNREPSWIDQDGKLAWRDGAACLNFGKHAGTPLKSVERSYLTWVTNQEWCPADTRAVLKAALKGTYPTQPMLSEVAS